MKIAVITPTIIERSVLLAECKESVRHQTIDCPVEHFIGVDLNGDGCGTVRNQVIEKLDPSFDWLSFLDDDDIMLPNHLAALSDDCQDYDVIYSDVECIGWTKSWKSQSFDAEALSTRNFIPVTVLIRRSTFESAGGFRKCFAEDWDLWRRCYNLGARFKYVPKITWQYRQIPGYSRMLIRGF